MNNETMTIEVNVGNLSEDERNQFRALIDKANTPPPKEWWESTEFDIQSGDRYYFIRTDGSVDSTTRWNAYQDDIIRKGNACKDKNYMEQRAKEIERSNRITNFAKVVNGDWEANWSDSAEKKYYIFFNHTINQYEVDWIKEYQEDGVIYFKSEELAQRCIDEVILPLERGEL